MTVCIVNSASIKEVLTWVHYLQLSFEELSVRGIKANAHIILELLRSMDSI